MPNHSLVLSADGNTLAELGVSGVHVFVRSLPAGSWQQQSQFAANLGGISLGMNAAGTLLATGGLPHQDNNRNLVNDGNLFAKVGSSWQRLTNVEPTAITNAASSKDFFGTSMSAYFGTSVAMSDDGNTIAVGAVGEDSNATLVGGDQTDNSATDSGAVYLY